MAHKVFFTADLHFGDTNWGRGKKAQMGSQRKRENQLVDNWNSVVDTDDIVYVLGDFAETVDAFIAAHRALNGTKVYLQGNHDPRVLFATDEELHRPFGERVFPDAQFLVGEGQSIDYKHKHTWEKFFISHRPFASWPWDTIHVHGHLHGGNSKHANEDYREVDGRCDVGVENWQDTPVDADTLCEKYGWTGFSKGGTFSWGGNDGLYEKWWTGKIDEVDEYIYYGKSSQREEDLLPAASAAELEKADQYVLDTSRVNWNPEVVAKEEDEPKKKHKNRDRNNRRTRRAHSRMRRGW
jgi:calcineurin-like phosphoesterase family protein